MDTQNFTDDKSRLKFESLPEAIDGCELAELVYTSAPRLLKSQAGHLGIVAETRDFPSEVVRHLSRFWSYSLPQELNIPETQAAPRFVLYPVGGASQAISLTRVQSAGFDHTGRTNPIAHHYVADFKALEANGLGIAEVVCWASYAERLGPEKAFLSRWIGEPAYLEKRRIPRFKFALSPFTLIKEISNAFCIGREVMEEAVFATADALRGYRTNQRMVVVVIKPTDAASILHFIGAVLCILPRSKQLDVTAISHVWEINDAPAGYSLAFTYPRSPYLERIKQRLDSKKPVVIDLARVVPEIPQANSSYLSFVSHDREQWDSKVNLPIPRLFDQVDPACEREAATFEFKQALAEWDWNRTHEMLAALWSSRRSCKSQGLSGTGLDRLVHQAGVITITKLADASDWRTLFLVFHDEVLPRQLRLLARDVIEQHISVIAEVFPELVAAATLEQEGGRLTKLLASRAEVSVDRILSAADSRALSLPDANVTIGVSNWALLGNMVIRRAWNSISNALSAGQPPSQFFRRILDRLIPLAIVKGSNCDLAAPVTHDKLKDEPGLESVLVPAWRIVSYQIQGGSSPHGLCKQIVDDLVCCVDVGPSPDSCAEATLSEGVQGAQKPCESDS